MGSWLRTLPVIGLMLASTLAVTASLPGCHRAAKSLTCGNGIVSPEEACDDANRIDGDGCSASCQVEQGWACNQTQAGPSTCLPICGDGLLAGSEECDGKALALSHCSDLGLGQGNLACNSQCRYDISGCASQATCGDGTWQYPERCDGQDLKQQTCQSLGLGSGTVACTDQCEWDTSGCEAAGICGNGVAEPGEECDTLDVGTKTCQDFGFYGGLLLCTDTCTLDQSNCEGVCGDGLCNGPERAATCPGDCRVVDIAEMCSGRQLSSPYFFACALRIDGTVWCWGKNNHGQFGNGTTVDSSTAVPVLGLDSVQDIAVGEDHACAVKSDGTVWCWGNNEFGQLGNETMKDSSAPVEVWENHHHDSAFTSARTVAAGGHTTCAIKSDGTVWCWGDNDCEQAGRTIAPIITTPMEVYTPDEELNSAVDIAVGACFACAVRTDGTVWCWGNWSHRACKLDTPTSIQAISSGDDHTCLLRSDATVWCWGNNFSGQLGDGTTEDSTQPVEVIGLTSVQAISAEGRTSCALKTDGTIWCWGLCWGADERVPMQVTSLGPSIAVAAGSQPVCAINTDGTVWCSYDDYDPAEERWISTQIDGL